MNPTHEMMQDLRNQFGYPLIGVIGATSPDTDYSADISYIAGYLLAAIANKYKGAVFTGGVDGVGVDVYMGATSYYAETKETPRFFTLIPHHYMVMVGNNYGKPEAFINKKKKRYIPKPYVLPFQYKNLEDFLKLRVGATDENFNLIEVRAGNDMGERRMFLAKAADVMIVINGGAGTLDEAIMAAEHNAPLIVVAGSGGTADDLVNLKWGRPITSFRNAYTTQEPIFFPQLNEINKDLIHIAASSWKLPEIILSILKLK
jgi:hypothetical protein